MSFSSSRTMASLTPRVYLEKINWQHPGGQYRDSPGGGKAEIVDRIDRALRLLNAVPRAMREDYGWGVLQELVRGFIFIRSSLTYIRLFRKCSARCTATAKNQPGLAK